MQNEPQGEAVCKNALPLEHGQGKISADYEKLALQATHLLMLSFHKGTVEFLVRSG